MSTTSSPRAPGRLGRFLGRLTPRTASAHEADELRAVARTSGASYIAEVRAGDRVVVAGTVRSLILRPRGGTPALEAELYDGSGRIVLVWLGRRRIGGIEPGRALVASGRATAGDGSLVIFNPRYELRPVHGG
jgi:hypothetical protein